MPKLKTRRSYCLRPSPVIEQKYNKGVVAYGHIGQNIGGWCDSL